MSTDKKLTKIYEHTYAAGPFTVDQAFGDERYEVHDRFGARLRPCSELTAAINIGLSMLNDTAKAALDERRKRAAL